MAYMRALVLSLGKSLLAPSCADGSQTRSYFESKTNDNKKPRLSRLGFFNIIEDKPKDERTPSKYLLLFAFDIDAQTLIKIFCCRL